ncbi:MAG: hypothetical protein A3E87_09390 [Gammaproteobacteria bacterium RIFCSPHIGHO2_12_FULL_35_23]|nr:MAG: hypothetical protein A3E87_09390 [Gammaproteobacteria bacterium RIFCSPHIGHO2_12_FULL_35_23]
MTINNFSLEELRNAIDVTDKEILSLLETRAELAVKIGAIKRKEQGEEAVYYRPERETKLLKQKVENYQGILPKASILQVFRNIMSCCRSLQKQHVIAYLGPAGTFSEMAMQQHFGPNEKTLATNSIAEVFTAVEKNQANYGIVPIENSTTGVISETVDLLSVSAALIIGEVIVPVKFHLLSQTNLSLAKIKILYLHSQAALQCKSWLIKALPGIKTITVSSNAEAAKLAAETVGSAALAGDLAADRYQLVKLVENVQDDNQNVTRFLVIGNEAVLSSGEDKTSLLMTAGHTPGALYQLLKVFASLNININLITSRPKQQAWRYFFYLEIDGHQQDVKIKEALQEIGKLSLETKILGSYPKAIKH